MQKRRGTQAEKVGFVGLGPVNENRAFMTMMSPGYHTTLSTTMQRGSICTDPHAKRKTSQI